MTLAHVILALGYCLLIRIRPERTEDDEHRIFPAPSTCTRTSKPPPSP